MLIKIIGAGIVGISTAVSLVEAGYQVQLTYAAPPSQTTSAVAGAIWLPYLAQPTNKILPWSAYSLRVYQEQWEQTIPGVQEIQLNVQHYEAHTPVWLELLSADKKRQLPATELLEGFVQGWELSIPLIDPLPYLQYWWNWLQPRIIMEQREVVSLEAELTGQNTCLINCTGLGAAALCQDHSLIPVRGHLLHLEPLKRAWNFLEEEPKPLLTYVFSRMDRTILGGTVEDNTWQATPDPKMVEQVYQRALERFPDLQSLARMEVQAGLRPVRKEVRVEKDPRLPIIHHYGHGGSGYTLAWGSAQTVLELVREFANL